MNRERVFRAFDHNSGIMIEGVSLILDYIGFPNEQDIEDLLKEKGFDFEDKLPENWADSGEDWLTIHDKVEVTEYVGISDNNEKLVYEGDIVQYDHEDGPIVALVEHKVHDDESINLSGYVLKFLYRKEYENDKCIEFEVIGNKFQNPELLTPLRNES